jgi:hypothetical protein
MRGAAGRRRRSPEWGVRDLEAVADLATSAGFGAPSIHPMPPTILPSSSAASGVKPPCFAALPAPQPLAFTHASGAEPRDHRRLALALNCLVKS